MKELWKKLSTKVRANNCNIRLDVSDVYQDGFKYFAIDSFFYYNGVECVTSIQYFIADRRGVMNALAWL